MEAKSKESATASKDASEPTLEEYWSMDVWLNIYVPVYIHIYIHTQTYIYIYIYIYIPHCILTLQVPLAVFLLWGKISLP
jgi:hypothetical protein